MTNPNIFVQFIWNLNKLNKVPITAFLAQLWMLMVMSLIKTDKCNAAVLKKTPVSEIAA